MPSEKPKSNPNTKPTSKEKSLISVIARASSGGFVSVEEAANALAVPTRMASIQLSRLAARGWLRRVKRGLYFVLPLEATRTEGGLAPDPWILATSLFSPCYIGGWSAAEHWELTEQLFQTTFVVTASNERSSQQAILGARFRVVRVDKKRIENSVPVWHGNQRIKVSSPEQTIVDGCNDPSWVGGFRHLSDMTVTYLESESGDIEMIVEEAIARRKGAIAKRLGYLLERYAPEKKDIVQKLKGRISSGLIKLDPEIKSSGKANNDWGVWVNVSMK